MLLQYPKPKPKPGFLKNHQLPKPRFCALTGGFEAWTWAVDCRGGCDWVQVGTAAQGNVALNVTAHILDCVTHAGHLEHRLVVTWQCRNVRRQFLLDGLDHHYRPAQVRGTWGPHGARVVPAEVGITLTGDLQRGWNRLVNRGMEGAAKCKSILSWTLFICITQPSAERTFCTLKPELHVYHGPWSIFTYTLYAVTVSDKRELRQIA